MRFDRRRLLQAAPALGLVAAVAPTTARAGSSLPTRVDTTDLVLATDPALAPALRAAAQAFAAVQGVRVHIFATPPALLLPQLQRVVQNDLVFTGQDTLGRLQAAGLLIGGRSAGWNNALWLAGIRAGMRVAPTTLIARPDPTPGSAIDGPAILASIGLATNPSVGAIDTGAVAWLLRHDAAPVGLVHATDLLTGPRLYPLAPVPPAVAAPIPAAGSLTRLARRPHPERFLAFLDSTLGRAALQHAGLEASA